jgi:ABC-2 type transport system ATP-binding protein
VTVNSEANAAASLNSSTQTPVIETTQLTKVYEGTLGGQDVAALKDLTLSVNVGEIFAYLGPNGSGKTTTIKMLLGLIFPSSGSIRILGKDDIANPAIRRQIGYLPEISYYPDFLKGEEVLDYYGRLYGLRGAKLKKRIDEVLEEVGMTRARKRLVRGYSKGMRQRIGLAQALISDPQIMILDEPTTGLDPIARTEIRDILLRMRERGKTLLVSSHELLEVELISDRVGILFEGDLKTLGTIDDLLSDRDVVIDVSIPAEETLKKVEATGITLEDKTLDKVRLRVPSKLSLYDAMEICKQEKLQVLSVAPQRETLEELFVRIVGGASKAARTAPGEEN